MPDSATIQSRFPKSRVYAKLLIGLILKCYQTFNRHAREGLDRRAHNT
jgi:hypothetical protein